MNWLKERRLQGSEDNSRREVSNRQRKKEQGGLISTCPECAYFSGKHGPSLLVSHRCSRLGWFRRTSADREPESWLKERSLRADRKGQRGQVGAQRQREIEKEMRGQIQMLQCSVKDRGFLPHGHHQEFKRNTIRTHRTSSWSPGAKGGNP